jgi:hypothetical protein
LAQFSAYCRLLIDMCELERTFPAFVAAADRFSKLFDLFNKFAAIILNSIHGNGDPRAHLEHSGIWQSGHRLVCQWFTFVTKFNEVVLGQTEQIFPFIIHTVDSISENLIDVADLFFAGTMKSVVDSKAVEEIGAELEEIRSIAGRRLGGAESALEYFQISTNVSVWIAAVFLGDMPRYTVKTGEIMLLRMQVKMSLQELCRLTAALATFDDVTSKVRQSAIGLNAEIGRLFEALGLPWRPELTEKATRELELEAPQLELRPVAPLSPREPQATSPRRRRARIVAPS